MKKKAILFVLSVVFIVCGLIIARLYKKNKEEWKKGIYILDHDIVVSVSEEKKSISLFAVVVGNDLLNDLFENKFVSYWQTNLGVEETFYKCHKEWECREYYVVRMDVDVMPGKRYRGFLMKDDEEACEVEKKLSVQTIDGLGPGSCPVKIEASIKNVLKESFSIELIVTNQTEETVTLSRMNYLNPAWIVDEALSKPFDGDTKSYSDYSWQSNFTEVMLPPGKKRVYEVNFVGNKFMVRYEIPSFVYGDYLLYPDEVEEYYGFSWENTEVMQYINGEKNDHAE